MYGPALRPPAHVLDLIEPQLVSDRIAVVDSAGGWTYRELDRVSAEIARRLQAGRGHAAPGGVVLHARLSRWAIAGMLGALRAGLRYVPVDDAFPIGRQALMYAGADTTSVLAEAGVSAHTGTRWRHYSLCAGSAGKPESVPVAPRATFPAAYTCFTSGSTGLPRPVTVSAAALAYSTAARLSYYSEPVSGFLLCSSISFDSSVAGIYWTLACGGRLIIPSDRPGNPVAVARAAREHAASHLLTVPSLYGLLVSRAASALAGLKVAIVAGETCPPELVGRHFAALPKVALYNEYGPTECTVWSTAHRCTPDDAHGSSVPIGGPIPGATLRLAPTDESRTELWVGGPGVVEAHASQGWYRTGDLVSRRPDGLLEFRGRLDNQLKLGGVRVELGEVEHALRAHPHVGAAAVGVVRRRSGDPVLIAFVTSRIDQRSLRAFLLDRLPAAVVPSRVVTLTALPTQPNGKLDRRALDKQARLLLGPPDGGG